MTEALALSAEAGLVPGWPRGAAVPTGSGWCPEGAGLQGTVAGGSSESEACSSTGQGLFAWLSRTGSGTSTGSSPPHTGSQEAQGTAAPGGSRCSPGPLLPHACTCDAATPLGDSLQTGTRLGPRTVSWDGDKEDGALSQHEDTRRELGQHLPFIVRWQ